MTYKEKWVQMHPNEEFDAEDDNYDDKAFCPDEQGLEDSTDCICDCVKCWNREMEKENKMDYSKVTFKEYQEKKLEILNGLGRTALKCINVSCCECPLDRRTNGIRCGALELLNPLEAVKRIMEYEPPVDWGKIKIDTKIFVRVKEGEEWLPRHFAKYKDGEVYAFADGKTSFTNNREYEIYWRFAKLAEVENG